MAYIKPLTGGDAYISRQPGTYYPRYIDPFYKNMLSVGALKEEWSDGIYGGFRIFERGGVRVDTRESDRTVQIRLGKKSKSLILQNGILRRAGGEVLMDKSPFEIKKEGNCLFQERKDNPKAKRLTNRRILIHVGDGNIFIGSIEPQEGYGYYLPHYHQEGEVTINIGIIYGRVILRTMPEGLFAMACNYNREGKMIGVCSRSPVDALYNSLKPNERAGYDCNVPVYFSYYDKNGKSITPKEYDDCLFVIIQQVTQLPTVLCGLLGYF